MPVADPEHPSRDALSSAISTAMARIKREFYGKGPERARTYLFDRYVFTMLDDVLTAVEDALKAGGRTALVRRLRLTFEDLMTDEFTGAVARLTGVPVVGYHSQVVFDPDVAMETFVLERALEERGPRGDGRLRTAVAEAMVRLAREQWGKGPVRAQAFLADEFVFCVLEEPLTTVERTLVSRGESGVVRHVRVEYEDMKAGDAAAAVAEITGRRVLACHNQVVFDPDVLFKVFVLDG